MILKHVVIILYISHIFINGVPLDIEYYRIKLDYNNNNMIIIIMYAMDVCALKLDFKVVFLSAGRYDLGLYSYLNFAGSTK